MPLQLFFSVVLFWELPGRYSGCIVGAENTSGKQMVGSVVPLKTELSDTVCTIRFPLGRRAAVFSSPHVFGH